MASAKNDRSALCPLITTSMNTIRHRCVPAPDFKVNDLLATSGFGTGFALPLASEENRLLEKKLEERQAQLLLLNQTITDDKEHVIEMRKHRDRMNYDVVLAHNLIAAKFRDLESQKSGRGYAESVKRKFKHDLSKEMHQLLEAKERVQSKMNELQNRRTVVKDLLSISEISNAAMLRWEEHVKTAEDEIDYIRRFAKVDEKFLKECQFKQKKGLQSSKQLSLDLNVACMNTRTLQDQFTRVRTLFRKAHLERTEMISLWGRTLQALKSRDTRIAALAEEYSGYRVALRGLTAKINENSKALEIEIQNKAQAFRGIHSVDKRLNDLRINYEQVKEDHTDLYSEQSNRAWELNHVSGELRRVSNGLKALDEEHFFISKKMAYYGKKLQKLERQLEIANEPKEDTNISCRDMETEAEELERYCFNLTEDIKHLRKLRWERSEDRIDIQAQIKLQQKKMQQIRTSLGANQKIDLKQMYRVDRQKIDIFHLDLHYNNLLRRFSEIEGLSDIPKDKVMEESVFRHREKYKTLREDKRIVQLEFYRNETHMISRDHEYAKALALTEVLEGKLRDIVSDCTSIEKSMLEDSKNVKNAVIDLHLQKIILHRLQNLITLETENLYDSTLVRATFKAAMNERRAEIKSHLKANQLLHKSQLDAMAKIKQYLIEINKHIHHQKDKFHVLTNFFVTATGADDFTTFTDVIFRVVEEREILIKEASKWKDKITEAEVELQGLENNVRLLVTSNCHFKISLAPALAQSCEGKKLQDEEAKTQAALMRKKHATRLIHQRKHRLEELENRRNVTKHHIMKMSHVCSDKVRFNSVINNELILQRDKILRWTNSSIKLVLDLREWIRTEELQLVQEDLKLRCLNEKFEYGVLMLEKFIGFCPQSKEMVLRRLEPDPHFSDTFIRLSHIGLPGYRKHSSRKGGSINTDAYVNFLNKLNGPDADVTIRSSRDSTFSERSSRRGTRKLGPVDSEGSAPLAHLLEST